MRYLLDTHTFIWFATGDKDLPLKSIESINDITNSCYLSTASLWEITIKKQIRKFTLDLSLHEPYDSLSQNQIEIIHISKEYLIELSKLPFHHDDPFDRLIIAQALASDLIVISKDKDFKKYKVNLQWK